MKTPYPYTIEIRVAIAILGCGILMAALSPTVADDTLTVEVVQSESTLSETDSEGSKSTNPCRHKHKRHAAEIAEVDTRLVIDFEKLKLRLRKTGAIGFFTKLELKGLIEDLFEEIEVFHKLESELSIEQLEEHFNLLLMKLLVLLQDDDTGLHREIVLARPTLWITLSDATSFKALIGT